MLEHKLVRQRKLAEVLRHRLMRSRSAAKAAAGVAETAASAAVSARRAMDTYDPFFAWLHTSVVTRAVQLEAQHQAAREQYRSAREQVQKTEEKVRQIDRRIRETESWLRRAAEERELETHIGLSLSDR